MVALLPYVAEKENHARLEELAGPLVGNGLLPPLLPLVLGFARDLLGVDAQAQ